MSETECDYWQIRRGMEHVAVLMREFLQDSSRNTLSLLFTLSVC